MDLRARYRSVISCTLALAFAGHGVGLHAQNRDVDAPETVPPSYAEPTDLPEPAIEPLETDFSKDPILALSRGSADPEQFRQIVQSAVGQNAQRREADASVALAQANLDEAEEGLLPTLDARVTSFRTLARDFGADPFNLIERSRPTRRTDVYGEVEYRLFNFPTLYAKRAAEARLIAAGLDRDATVVQLATDIVSAWYSVFTYQSLERLSVSFVASQDEIESALERRIEQGVSARSDLSRIASLRAEGEIGLAQYRRRLASAEARFRELIGAAPPPLLLRPPILEQGRISRDYAIAAAQGVPEVRSAEAQARAAKSEYDSSFAQLAPELSARVDAGRYGVFEDREDYDIRGSLNMRFRILGGGGLARVDAASARVDAAEASADRTREEATRLAAITWADVQALEEQLAALEASYRAARQTRDVVFRRFGALRGSLFDVTEAQRTYFSAATAYIEGLTQLDAARYILLARTGRLLAAFENEVGEEWMGDRPQ